jgi:putative transposase
VESKDDAEGGRDRRAQILRFGPDGTRPTGAAQARAITRKQPGGEIAPAYSTTRAKDAGFKSQPSAQKFLTTYAAVYNTFNTERHLISRKTLRVFRANAHAAWAAATAFH